MFFSAYDLYVILSTIIS